MCMRVSRLEVFPPVYQKKRFPSSKKKAFRSKVSLLHINEGYPTQKMEIVLQGGKQIMPKLYKHLIIGVIQWKVMIKD